MPGSTGGGVPAGGSPAGGSPAGGSGGGAATTAILLMLGAVLQFQIMAALIKWLGPHYPLPQIVFFRSAIAMLPVLPMIWRAGGVSVLRTARPGAHALRALYGLSSMFLTFWAVAQMPLADYTALWFTMPILLTALSVPLLGEIVGIRRWTAVAIGFAGALLIAWPTGETPLLPAVCVVLAAGIGALAMISIRRMSVTEPSTRIVFWYMSAAALVSAAMLPFSWVTPSWLDLGLLVAVGLVGGVAQILMTQAYRLAAPSVVAPFEYTALLWGVALGWLVWDVLPGGNVVIGAALVIVSGLYILYRETVRARARR